ncbi:Protein of unknown function [Marininema mesophilum]|uniref:Haemolysin XhlA n=1 Tax=Marininema mesophilum TaxID=1048340 RepID=A0A1H3BTY0_9BACL|nr:alanine-zipper protein [Marininema mesophilum]SDX44814.1 Protein of unknown function [Marininema mesophilum]
MGESGGAVIISPKEMYQLLQEVSTNLQDIKSDIRSLKDKAVLAEEAEDRSREAQKQAEKAQKMAEEALKAAEETKSQVKTLIVAPIVTGVIGGIVVAIFYFAKIGLGG